MIVIDIGAHIGSFIDLYPEATVYAFEPNPINYDFLIHKYPDKPNIHIYNLAISAEHGKTRLYRCADDGPSLLKTGRCSILPTNRDVMSDRFWDVETTRLTTFIHDNNIDKVDILKIDAEGIEYEILEDLVKGNQLDIFQQILYEDHSFLFQKHPHYIEEARRITHLLYERIDNPHRINYGNINTPWSSCSPYIQWRLELI